MIKFSIITVCLNAGDDLIDTVASTLDQTYENFEIIVKDGFSSDGSVERLPMDSRIRLIRQKDTGIYDAMNQGIDEATGDFLIFMNAGDHFFEKSTLEKIVKEMDIQEAQLYYGRCYNESLKCFSNSPKRITPFFCYRTMICHQGMVVAREYLMGKKYDCSYKVSADRELLLHSVIKAKLTVKRIPVVVAEYQGAGFCESKANQKRIQEEDQRLKRVYFSKWQNMHYRARIMLTLPGLRRKIVKNPKLARLYKRLIGFLYGNK